MNKTLLNAFFSLLIVLALLFVINFFTQAYVSLQNIDINWFLLSAIAFLASILLWILSWSHLIKKHSRISYANLTRIGFRSLYGALTPIQLGAEAIRSLQLKQYFGVRFSQSISASMVAKGTKFLIIAIFSVIVILLTALSPALPPLVAFGLGTGFIVILLATLLFLLPLKKSYGIALSNFFGRFRKNHGVFAKLSKFFRFYSAYLKDLPKRTYLIVLFLCLLSWVLEFTALQAAFLSLNILISLKVTFILLVLVSILERTPFLPRGIGLVEVIGYSFLAFPIFHGLTLSVSEIGAVLVVFDVVRLVVPTILSIIISLVPMRQALRQTGKPQERHTTQQLFSFRKNLGKTRQRNRLRGKHPIRQ